MVQMGAFLTEVTSKMNKEGDKLDKRIAKAHEEII